MKVWLLNYIYEIQIWNHNLGIRVGVDWTWAGQSDPEVFQNFKKTVEKLETLGCEIFDISIPELSYGKATIYIW